MQSLKSATSPERFIDPQNQGLAENRVKFATKVLVGFVKNHPNNWLHYLPAAEGAMRAVAMAALGGQSPMEVVMGLKPQLPATLTQALPVEHMGSLTMWSVCWKT